MADINDLPINTRVMAPLGEVMLRGVIIEFPADRARGEHMVCVEFTPPLPDAYKPNEAYTNVTCDAGRVELGWHDSSEAD